jgi:hypothetical protein
MPNWHQLDEQKSQAFEEPDYAGYNNVSDDTQCPTGASVTIEQLHLFSEKAISYDLKIIYLESLVINIKPGPISPQLRIIAEII